MKLPLALASLAVVSESIVYCRMKYPVRPRVSRVLVRMAGRSLMSRTLYSHACKYYRHVIISPHDTIEL
jgi:hypothetical protein